MNTQAYIESGILEEYVLGVVSPQEKQEVECLSHIYPEVKAELTRLESTLESYALQHAQNPPRALKDKIFAQMEFASEDDITETEPVLVEESAPESAAEIRIGQQSARPLWALMAVAASVVLALVSSWAVYQLTLTNGQNEKLAAQMKTLQTTADNNQTIASYYRNPDVRIIRMPGLDKAPESTVVALWNQQTQEVFLDVQNLPAAPAGKQYQLWTIVDGKPVDMGVLAQDYAGRVLQMKRANATPAAFAITLEKEGGSPSPTLEEMYVMGKV
ncbi:anti-sigma factor [Arundinibacter roseus]|uniref:Anti-sigma factor n=1 Tax=Arundinibacter roseus TaxID=2070510 RepID=A0A4R4KGX3_9BACT|nr:anti-sigma factor [Arundinibacter roseus]TDB65789.1 anti-sigma factor [Arundinibacter roseus]